MGSSCCHFWAKYEFSEMWFAFILSAARLPQAFWVDVEDNNHVWLSHHDRYWFICWKSEITYIVKLKRRIQFLHFLISLLQISFGVILVLTYLNRLDHFLPLFVLKKFYLNFINISFDSAWVNFTSG